MEREIPLSHLGERLGVATERVRKRNYTLFLEGPPTGTKPRRWANKIEKAALAFVASGEKGTLDLEGAWITAYGSGAGWTVAVVPRDRATTPSGGLPANIQANIEDMLRHALSVKAPKIAPLKAYDRKALLMWNTYFFGDEVHDVERALKRLMHESAEFAVFDIIFYVTDGQLSLLHGQDLLLSSNGE